MTRTIARYLALALTIPCLVCACARSQPTPALLLSTFTAHPTAESTTNLTSTAAAQTATPTSPPLPGATATPAPTFTATPTPTPLAVRSPAPAPSMEPELLELLGSRPTLLYRHMEEEVLYAWDEGARRGYRLMALSHRAGHIALSPAGYLAYTLDGALYLADLSAAAIHPIYEDQDHPDPDWDLLWSTDGEALAYALAWDELDGSRMVELGTCSGAERRLVSSVEARSGPVPTPPSEPPIPLQPGFGILHLLGYDRVAGRILATPAGGQERYSVVWAFDAAGQTTLLAFDDPEAVEGMAASPDLAYLAVRRTPARVVLYDLAATQAEPLTFTIPAGMHPGPLHWSPNGRWLAFLLFEGDAPGLTETPALGLQVLDTGTMQGREGLSLPRVDSASLIGWHPDGRTLLIEWHGGAPRRRHFQMIDAASWQATEVALGESDLLVRSARPIGWIHTPFRATPGAPPSGRGLGGS